jgi:hypothetical protein
VLVVAGAVGVLSLGVCVWVWGGVEEDVFAGHGCRGVMEAEEEEVLDMMFTIRLVIVLTCKVQKKCLRSVK